MIFVDTNVFMYAVGRPYPLKSEAQDFFAESAVVNHPCPESIAADPRRYTATAELPRGALLSG